MDTELLEKFDPSKLMEGVKDRIKSTFVSLIPDDKWEEMVDKEIKSFFEDKVSLEITKEQERRSDSFWEKDSFFITKTEQSPFQALVWRHCVEQTQVLLRKKFTTEYFEENYTPDTKEMKEGLKEVLVEIGPTLISKYLSDLSNSAIQSQLVNFSQNGY